MGRRRCLATGVPAIGRPGPETAAPRGARHEGEAGRLVRGRASFRGPDELCDEHSGT